MDEVTASLLVICIYLVDDEDEHQTKGPRCG